jgi:putative aminopeptidase FrvX
MSIHWFDQALVDQRWQIMTAKGPVAAVSGFIDKHAHTAKDDTRVTVSDAASRQKYSTGRPAIVFAVPTRYTHLHTGVTDWVDLDHAIDLLVAVLTHLDGGAVAGLTKF